MTSDIQQSEQSVKKTALDYVKPHNHNAVPLALAYAEQDYFNHRTYGVIEYALELGAKPRELAKRMGVTQVIFDRLIRKFGGTK